MCHSGTSSPPVPSSTPAAAAPALGGPVSCGAVHNSAILLIDELGIPMAGASVSVTVGGVTSSTTADGSGIVCFSVPPGTNVSVQLVDMHEARAGESTTTPSGHHFLAGGTGP